MTRILSVIVLMIAAVGPGLARQPAPRAEGPTRLDIRIEPFVNLHFMARAVAVGEMPAPSIEGFEGVVGAVEELGTVLGGGRGWQQFDGNIARCASAQEALGVFAGLPEGIDRGGTSRPLREPALAYARALGAVEGAYLREIWEPQKQGLERARARLKERLGPHERACLDSVMKALAMTDPGAGIPVYLVARAPAPGASTVMLRGGGAVCFVSVEGVSEGEFLESVLHESIHALDIATAGKDTALNRLRRMLAEAGMPATDPRQRDLWHTLMFLQAGETVRRVIDPAHKHYGDTAGYYAKVAEVAALERPIWKDYLDGAIGLDEALGRIVDGGAKARPKDPDRQ